MNTRLHFIGHRPPSALTKLLFATGIALTSQDKPSEVISPCEVLFLWITEYKCLDDLPALREALPHAWIVLVAPKKKLSTEAFQTTLLECEEKDEVWIQETWELGFWFALQRILKSQLLRADYDALSQNTERLIAQLEKDVGLATNIQRALLPKFSPEIAGISVAVKYLPAAGAGGDYYDIFEFGDKHRYGVLLADSKTHGMAAALLGMLLKVRLEELKDRFPDSNSFLDFLNREFQTLPKKETAPLSLLYGILDRRNLVFSFTSAGPLLPMLYREGRMEDLGIAPSPQLGTAENHVFREHEIRLQPGDLLVLHTDGLAATLGKPPKETLTRILNKKKDPQEIQNELMAMIDRAREKRPLPDDVTVIHLAIHDRALYVA